MVDGYLNFDTAIESKGFDKGLQSLDKKFLKSAVDIKAAFDMVIATINRAITSFKNLTDAYRTQIEQEARLGATMKNSTSATKKQIDSVKELASSLQEVGIVGDEVQLAGAQELATYVENVDSIKKILPVLNDMIAQQYGYAASTDSAVAIATMLGKVLQGQTSALSRYGYKFDEAQEKILKYGNEQQRVATLAAVIEESVAGVNIALAETPTGKVKQLSNDFGDLKETLGGLLTEIVYPLVQKLDIIVKKLNAALQAASTAVKGFFGITGDSTSVGGIVDSTEAVEDSSAAAADNYGKMAKNAEKVKKANEGSLAAFDELHVLQQPEEDEADTEDITEDADAINEATQAAMDAQVAIEDVDSAVNDVDFTSFQQKIQAVIEFFKPLVEGVKGFFKALSDSVTAWWNDSGSEAFEKLKTAFASFKAVIVEIWNNVLKPFFQYIGSTLKEFWNNHMKPLWSELLEFFSALWECIAALWERYLLPLYENSISTFLPGVLGVLKSLWDMVIDVFTIVVDVIKNVIRFAKGLLEFITGVFTGDFEKAFDGIEDMFGALVNTIWVLFKGAFNLIIDALNTLWSGLYGVLQSIINGVGSFVSMIGDALGHESWGFELPNEVPRIPRLATGTVIPANYGEFAAILGDNKREAEVVSPVSAIKQAMLEAMTEAGLTGASRTSDTGDIVINISGYEWLRIQRREIEKYKRAHAGALPW